MQVVWKNYHLLLTAMKLPPEEIEQRMKAAMETTERLKPMAPQVDRLLGPAKPTKDVLDALDRQYREQGKPDVWFLSLSEPISPYLDEILGPLPEDNDQ